MQREDQTLFAFNPPELSSLCFVTQHGSALCSDFNQKGGGANVTVGCSSPLCDDHRSLILLPNPCFVLKNIQWSLRSRIMQLEDFCALLHAGDRETKQCLLCSVHAFACSVKDGVCNILLMSLGKNSIKLFENIVIQAVWEKKRLDFCISAPPAQALLKMYP